METTAGMVSFWTKPSGSNPISSDFQGFIRFMGDLRGGMEGGFQALGLIVFSGFGDLGFQGLRDDVRV